MLTRVLAIASLLYVGEPSAALESEGPEQSGSDTQVAAETDTESESPPPAEAPREGPAVDPGHEQLARVIDERAAPIGPVGATGLAFIGGGLTTAAVAMILSIRLPSELELDGHLYPTYAVGLIGAGLASTLIGVTMLTVDLTHLERQRSSRAIRLHFELSPTQAGVQLRGRF